MAFHDITGLWLSTAAGSQDGTAHSRGPPREEATRESDGKQTHTHMQFSAENPMWKLMPLQYMDISEDGRQVEPHDVAAWDDMEPGDKSPFVVDGGGAPC